MGETFTREVIDTIASMIEAGAMFESVDSIDHASATLILIGTNGDPYEVRVRRVTEADCLVDHDGVLPPPVVCTDDES